MTKVTIYLSLKDGELFYRDSEDNSGKEIKTPVKPGTTISWCLDENSGINNLSGINIDGAANFFAEGPCKQEWNCWSAKVGEETEGTISYQIYYTKDGEESSVKTKKSVDVITSADAPQIIIRI